MRTGQVFHIERCPTNPKLQKFVQWWAVNGPFPIVITYGRRDETAQLALFAIGRTVQLGSKPVTQAEHAIDSAHGHDGAIDCEPVRDSAGDLVRSIYTGAEADPAIRAHALALLDRYVLEVRAHELESGRDFPGLHDDPHAQDPAWRSLPYPPPDASSPRSA